MSHEIRTQINGVLGMTELLLHTNLTDKQTHFAQSARRSGEALLGIINDILDFSKIDAGKLELEKVPFDLRELVDDMGQLFAESAQSKGLELICSLPQESHTAFMGDVGRMRQILTNLLGNSIKFTEAGEVALHVTTSIEEERFSHRDIRGHRHRYWYRRNGAGKDLQIVRAGGRVYHQTLRRHRPRFSRSPSSWQS